MKRKKSPKKISVLLTSTGGFGATSYIDCLKNNYENRNIRVVCSDVVDQPIMHYKADCFHLLPKGNSKKYIPALIKLCKKENIDVVIPCSGSEVFTISKNIKLLNSHDIFSTVPNFEVVKKTMNKAEIYQLLQQNGISVPQYFLVHNKDELKKALRFLGYPKNPVCFKPNNYRSSGGSRGFRILREKNSISDIIVNQKPTSVEIDYESTLDLFNKDKNIELLFSEFLPGIEWDVYVLAKEGTTVFSVPMVRQRVEEGFAFESLVKENNELTLICEKITNILKISYNSQIQFRLSRNNQPKFIELNPRVAGGISLPAAAGINLLYLSVKLALNEKLPASKIIYNTKMIRFWKELFIQNSENWEYP